MNFRATSCNLVGCMLLTLVIAVTGTAAAVPAEATASEHANDCAHQRTEGIDRGQQRRDRRFREEFLYVAAINSGEDVNPDFLAVVGADPRDRESYGRIVARVDLPNVGDNVHHSATRSIRSACSSLVCPQAACTCSTCVGGSPAT